MTGEHGVIRPGAERVEPPPLGAALLRQRLVEVLAAEVVGARAEDEEAVLLEARGDPSSSIGGVRLREE